MFNISFKRINSGSFIENNLAKIFHGFIDNGNISKWKYWQTAFPEYLLMNRQLIGTNFDC